MSSPLDKFIAICLTAIVMNPPPILFTRSSTLSEPRQTVTTQDSGSPVLDVIPLQQKVSGPTNIDIIISEFRRFYASIETFSEDQFDAFAEYLRQLAQEVITVLASPEKFAPIFAEVMVVGGVLKIGFLLGNYIVESGKGRHENEYIQEIGNGFRQIQEYFEHVPQSRLAEIVSGTGLEREIVSLLLRLGEQYGVYDHQPSCFWKLSEVETIYVLHE